MGSNILKFKVLIWFYQALMADRDRWPLWLPVLLGVGIGIYFALPFEPPLWLGWGSFVVLGFMAWARRTHSFGQAMLILALAFIALGMGLSGLRTWWVAAPVIAHELKVVTVEGQILRLETRPKGLRVTLGHLHINRLGPDQTPTKVRITLSGAQPQFVPGDWLSVLARLNPPSPPAQPGAFDFQRQSYFRGLGGVGFSYGRARLTGHAPSRGIASLGFALERLRSTIAQNVRSTLAGDTGAVAAALMTGDRGAISEHVLDNMRSSGLAHLLAISGLHVGLITSIVFFVVRAILALIQPLALKYPIKKWAALVAIIGAGGYAVLAGATVPTQRAFLMIGLVLVAVMFDRRALSMRSVAWAALVILSIAPESLTGASFQLSFAAVVALISVYEVLHNSRFFQSDKQTGLGRTVLRYVSGVAITTLVAGMATAIFAAFHFNRVADFSLVANVIAVPVTALWIMPWAVLSYVLMPLGLEHFALIPMGWGVDVVLATANGVAHLPGAVSLVAAFPLWGLVLVTFGGLWGTIWHGRWRVLGLPLAVLGISSLLWSVSPDILVNSTGQLAAVKMPNGNYRVSTLRAKRFEREIWLRRAGLMAAEGDWQPSRRPPEKEPIACDALGCVFKKDHRTIAFIKRPEALFEDCEKVQVLVSLNNFGTQDLACNAEIVIRYQDLKQNGAHAFYFTDTGVRVETVQETRGLRPWVLR